MCVSSWIVIVVVFVFFIDLCVVVWELEELFLVYKSFFVFDMNMELVEFYLLFVYVMLDDVLVFIIFGIKDELVFYKYGEWISEVF